MTAKETTQRERLQICKSCEHNKFDICMKCGCILRLKVKLKNVKCPLDKWGEEQSDAEQL